MESNNVIHFPNRKNSNEYRKFEVPYGQYLRQKEESFASQPQTEDGERGKRIEANALGVCKIPAHVKINPQASLGEMISVAISHQPEEYDDVTRYIISRVENHVGLNRKVDYFTAVDSPLDFEKGVDGGFMIDGLPVTFDLKTGIDTQNKAQADMVFALNTQDIKGSIEKFAREVAEHARGIDEYREYKSN